MLCPTSNRRLVPNSDLGGQSTIVEQSNGLSRKRLCGYRALSQRRTPAMPGPSSIHHRSVTSGPRRHRALVFSPQARPRCKITGCGISIAVPEPLDCRRAALRSRVVVFGGSRRLRGQCSNYRNNKHSENFLSHCHLHFGSRKIADCVFASMH